VNNVDWNLIRSFVAVAETGSLSGAARDLTTTQPTIGRHVTELEAALNLTLFHRNRRGMELAEAGLALMNHAKRMSETADSFVLAATGQSTKIEGPVRITASEIVSTYYLPKLLAELHVAEPELQIELVASDAVQNLLRADADIAIRMVAPEQGELIAQKIGDMEVGIFASDAYLARNGHPQSLEALFSHTLVGQDRQTLIVNGITQMGFSVLREDFSFRCDFQPAYFELIKRGAGIGFLSKALAKDAQLVALFPQLPIPSIPIWITAHRELRTSLRLRTAFDFLSQRLKHMKL